MCIWSGRNQIPWLCRAARKQIVEGRGKIVEHGHLYRHVGRGTRTGSEKDQCAFADVTLPRPSSAPEPIIVTGAIFWLIPYFKRYCNKKRDDMVCKGSGGVTK